MATKELNIPNLLVYGEEDKTLSPYFVHVQSMKWDKKKHMGHVEPHMHSHLFQMAIISGGNIQFKCEEWKENIKDPTIVFIPEDYLHSFRFLGPTKGWILSISSVLMEEFIKALPVAQELSSYVNLISDIKEKEKFRLIRKQCDQLFRFMEITDNGGVLIKKSMAYLILTLSYQLFSMQHKVSMGKKSRSYNFLFDYKKMLRENLDAGMKVKDYAHEMNITSTHLNRVCKTLTNLSASEIMHETIIQEAKKFLNYSSYTVSEIAYELKFKDPSHFSKYFKSMTGFAPKSFRSIREESAFAQH